MSTIQQTTVPTIDNIADFDKYISSYLQKNDKLSLFLDYDGTLAPLAAHPSLTAMEPESEASLHNLINHPNVFMAIISGREPENAKEKVALPNITYAGNHGLEIHYPNGDRYLHQLPDDVKANFTNLVNELKEKMEKDGAWVEVKKSSLTFHFRDVPIEFHEQLNQEASAIVKSYGYWANSSHCSIEAKPPVEWNKGKAALHLLQGEFGDNWHLKTKVIFAGDDTTDEDAMKALKGHGRSFRVSDNKNIKTFADFRLPSTKTVSILLQWIESRL